MLAFTLGVGWISSFLLPKAVDLLGRGQNMVTVPKRIDHASWEQLSFLRSLSPFLNATHGVVVFALSI